jgi:imidazolonepropionase-like amidohydrolase
MTHIAIPSPHPRPRSSALPIRAALVAAAWLALAHPPAAVAQARPVLIRAGEVHTVTNGVIRDGEILLRGGVIEQVGRSLAVPDGADVYEAEVVIPGLIDAHTHIALDRSSQAGIPGPFTPEWKAVEHLDLDDPTIQVALSGGVTSVITRPGSGIISSGQSVALKMKRRPGPEMILKVYADLKMAVRPLINLRPGETPQTVMGWYATADDYFRRATEYLAAHDAYAAGETDAPPEHEERLEALLPVLRGEVMVHTHAHYPSEVMMVLRLARKYGFIDRLALAHAEEIFPMIDLLKGTAIVPVVGPMMIVQYFNDPEPMNLLEVLLDAGITASIQTDVSGQHIRDFREYGAFLARHGLTDQQALEVMTINGARAMMLEDRIGSIEVGKDADLVLLDGHFLDLSADRVERVFVDGVLEYERGEAAQPERPRRVGPFAPLRNEIRPDDRSFVITGAHVFTISRGELRDATLVVEDGRFTRVEAGGSVPPGLPVMDAGGRVVMPGTIIARAFPNDWIGDLKWQVQNDEISEPLVPEMNALYAVDPWFPSYRLNTRMGVTAIHVTPGTQNVVGGSGVVVKTPGMDVERMVRREPSAIVMSLTSGTLRAWPDTSGASLTLLGASEMIRGALHDARGYADERPARAYDPRHEALLPLLRRDVPALIHADRVDEIREALAIAEDHDLRLVITGGVEAHVLADELAAADVGVILGNSGSFASDIRGGGPGWSVEGPAILVRAGVKVAFFGPGASRRAAPTGRLAGEPILNSAWAFRNGVPEVDALRMATLNAAELLDMDDRIGSIDVGKDADFVVLEGHPFDYRVVPSFVFVDGQLELEPH